MKDIKIKLDAEHLEAEGDAVLLDKYVCCR